MIFEYKIIGKNRELNSNELNNEGNDGWELIQIICDKGVFERYTYYLKRKKEL